MKKSQEVKNIYTDSKINTVVYSINISDIKPNPSQPRTYFDISSISKLADSIKQYGLLQPLSIRKSAESQTYELVAGERRLRACRMLGLTQVPCILIDADIETSAELAIAENITRRDLNVFEQARAFAHLSSQFHLTQEEIAAKMSLSQSAVANKLRLLKLTPDEQASILQSELSERHARALLRIQDTEIRKKALKYITHHKLNVCESEKYISSLIATPQSTAEAPTQQTTYTSSKICSSIYKLISKIQKSNSNNLIVNRKSDGQFVTITLTIKKDNT